MKKFFSILLFALLFASASWGQNQLSNADSARLIIDKYLEILRHDAIKADSMLYIESIVVSRSNTDDTCVLKRWYLAPNCYRVELWNRDTLLFGLMTDGLTIHKRITKDEKRWEDISISEFMDLFPGYDFHGPFAHYKVLGWDIRYEGIWNFNGHEVYKIFVQAPHYYDRYYLFEKESNLLFLIDEQETLEPNTYVQDSSHVDWRAYHEYTPLGFALFPSIESYQIDGEITTIFSNIRYVAKDEKIFKK